jgi:hypothetical protein
MRDRKILFGIWNLVVQSVEKVLLGLKGVEVFPFIYYPENELKIYMSIIAWTTIILRVNNQASVPVTFMTNTRYNSIQFFIIYVSSQQLQGQLQTEHSVDTSNYIMDKYYIKATTN